MITDEELRRALRAQAGEHEPDLDRMRARVEAGPYPVAHLHPRASRPGHRGRRALRPAPPAPAAAAGPGRSWAPAFRPAVLVAAVVCAVTLLIHPAAFTALTGTPDAAREPADRGPAAAPAVPPPPASSRARTPSSTRPAAPSEPSVTAPAARPKAAVSPVVCANNASVRLAPFRVSNNLWAAERGKGSQCVQGLSRPGAPVSWTTTWTWSGRPHEVKSFANVTLGWEWGWQVPGTGLPVRTSQVRAIPTSWAFALSERTPSDLDVGYDLWFHARPPAGGGRADTPSAEVRILLFQEGSRFTGDAVGSWVVDGARWDLYLLKGGGWPVYTFARRTSTRAATLDLMDFVDRAESVGPATFTWLSSVQAGANVRTGAGRLTTSSYTAAVER